MVGVGTNLRAETGAAEGPCKHLCCDQGSSGRCSEQGGEGSVASCPEELPRLSPRELSHCPSRWPSYSTGVPAKMMLCVAPSPGRARGGAHRRGKPESLSQRHVFC